MTIQPARHDCYACCPLQAEKPGIQPVVGNTRGTRVDHVVSSFQKIVRGSQLTWYVSSIRLFICRSYGPKITLLSSRALKNNMIFFFAEIFMQVLRFFVITEVVGV